VEATPAAGASVYMEALEAAHTREMRASALQSRELEDQMRKEEEAMKRRLEVTGARGALGQYWPPSFLLSIMSEPVAAS
jgi:hypothetical protein